MIPTDPLYASQWHFTLMGNIQRIWDEYSGAGVHVGVYDDGIDFAHADLAANYDATRQVRDDLNVVVGAGHVAPGDGHGTATAGLIGARANNGVGGVGVAWGTSLTAVNIFGGAGVYGDVNGAFAPFVSVVHQAAANFDISSNSWGASPLYLESLAGGGFADLLENEYSFLSSNGRGGRGTIITQAAGNDTLDANGDGVNASRFTITVSATEQTGIVANYSNFGACILVAAPAAAVTTDRTGAAGYDPGDYTAGFNGTSAATPVVSGVIALMLQANPNLGWRDVQNILANSASHTGSAFGGPKDVDEHGLWGFNHGDNWNGGGMHIQTDYGYGMINAYNAVRMAEVWTLFGAAQTSANEQTVSSALQYFGGTPLAVPDNNPAGVNFTITTAGNLLIEHAVLRLNLAHTYMGDLNITLTSAEGTVIVAALNSGGASGNFNGIWEYGLDNLRGELSAGVWSVNISDNASLDTGTVTSAQMVFYGTTPSANDVFHFTDEFLAMKAIDPLRGVITDADGGIDWLDFSTAFSFLNLSLQAGSTFFVGGAAWGTIGAAAAIENAIGGDGEDIIGGNSGDNALYGMRNSDFITGEGGADSLYGGAGDDQFLYTAAADLVAGEIINGGTGTGDTIVIEASGAYLLTLATISGVEKLNFDVGVSTASLSGAQIGTGFIASVVGSAAVNTLTVTGASVNLTGVAFTGWTDGTDVININGTAGVDNLIGGGQREIIQAGALDDFLYGNGGDDQLYGAGGADYMSGGNDGDYMSGGAGVDTFFGGAGVDTIIGGDGDDLFYILAGDGGDIIVDYSGQGNDRILTAISYSLSSGSEIETLSTNSNAGVVSINLTGNTLHNIVIGNNGVNVLDGGLGNDTLYGLGGAVDYFTFSTVANTATNSDTIADWSSAGDLIFLDDAAFTGMAAGTLAAAAFLSGAGLTAAATAAQRVIVNTTNGDLWWDQDGLGGLASVRFANIGAAHPVFNYDFFGI